MVFIKIENVVINTAYIAAVRLANKTLSGEYAVSILIATPKFPLFQEQLGSQEDSHYYEWLDFTGKEALVLQDYFSSCNNVIDLLPQPLELNGSTTY